MDPTNIRIAEWKPDDLDMVLRALDAAIDRGFIALGIGADVPGENRAGFAEDLLCAITEGPTREHLKQVIAKLEENK